MKKIFICVLTILCLTFSLTGCALFNKTTNPTEEEISNITEYHFQNEEYVNSVLAKYQTDSGFKIDGILDESVWQSDATAWHVEHFMSTDENPVEMTTKSYFGQKGVYMAFQVTDKAVYYSENRNASANTSVEVYIADSATTEWTGNTFRISIVPTGKNQCMTEMWSYRPKFAQLTEEESLDPAWRRWYQPHISACNIRGTGINTATNQGYDVELFIPYESFALTSKPEVMQYMTAFNHVESVASDATRQWQPCYPTCYNNKLGTWLLATNEKVGLYEEMTKWLDSKVTTGEDIITLDGQLSESVWDESKAFVQSAVKAEEGINADITWMTHLTENGLYVGAKIQSSNVFASFERDMKYNTGIEFWVQSSSQKSIDYNTCHIRVDALGRVTKYKPNLNKEFVQNYFPSKSCVKLNGCEVIDNQIASNIAQGFSVETFIPWSSLGISKKPNSIALYPQYAQALDLTNTDNSNELFQFFGISGQDFARKESDKCFVQFIEQESLGVNFDGAVTQSDGYTSSYSFLTTDAGGKKNEATVSVKDCGKGVAIALTLNSEYINYATLTEGSSTGNNGGGFEIMMAGEKLASDDQGICWRMFADGSARSIRNVTLNNGYPLSARNFMPVGMSNLYEVGLVANENGNGYKQMTVEFYFSYAVVEATSAKDFYFAVAVNGTGVTNNTLNNAWLTGESNTQKPSEDAWQTVEQINNLELKDQLESVNGKFKASTTLAEGTYLKGVTFEGDTITEGAHGEYTVANPQVEKVLTAHYNGKTKQVKVVSGIGLDGVVDAIYTNKFDYSVSYGDGAADISAYWHEGQDAIYFAFDVTETGAGKYLVNTGSGNQGTAGVNFFVKNNTITEGFKGYYYRAWASGLVRFKDLSTANGNFYPGNPTTLNYFAGNKTVASGDTSKDDNITSYVLEWKLSYASLGVTNASQLSFAFGWITANQLDAIYVKDTGATREVSAANLNALSDSTIWYSYAELQKAKG